MQQLQQLHSKLDVDHASRSAFEVAGGRPLFHSQPHGPDLLNGSPGPAKTVAGSMDCFSRPARRLYRANHDTGFDQRLSLPNCCRAIGGKVTVKGIERDGQRTVPATGPQSRIDLIEPALRCEGVEQLQAAIGQLAKEMTVRGPRFVGCWWPGYPIVIVEKHDVDITGIVHLLAPELAHCQHHHASVGLWFCSHLRSPKLIH